MTYNVLFLCTGNSARSIMGEALLNYWGQGASGLQRRKPSQGPGPSADPRDLERATCRRGAAQQELERVLEPGAPKLDFVFTVCGNAAQEQCPYWPGQPMTAHWGIDDPAAVEGTESSRLAPSSERYASWTLASSSSSTSRSRSSTSWRCSSGCARSAARR